VASPPVKFDDALAALLHHKVRLVVVGGVAAALNGAPISTFDLDIVHARDADNLDRLLAALGELEACYRDQTGRRLPPLRAHLEGDGHNLLSTKHGPLDVLGTIGKGHDYESLLSETIELALDDLTVRVLDLPALIRIKEETARDKDRAVLAILRRTLEERDRQRRHE
jgi:hypothetical protein